MICEALPSFYHYTANHTSKASLRAYLDVGFHLGQSCFEVAAFEFTGNFYGPDYSSGKFVFLKTANLSHQAVVVNKPLKQRMAGNAFSNSEGALIAI